MAEVRCPNCHAKFNGEASVDGNYRVMRCPSCDFPMTDLIVPFLRGREQLRQRD